jgi:hypothetical protein
VFRGVSRAGYSVFAEYVAELREGGARRFAAIHPTEDGELTGTFGYGRDESTAV